MKKTLTTPVNSFDTVVVNGASAVVDVRTAENLTEALIEITGPEAVIREARADLVGAQWVLELPKGDGGTTVVSGGNTTIINGTDGGVFIQAGTLNGVTSGNVTIISGGGQVHVTDQQVHVSIRVPRGTNLHSTLTAGALTATHAQLGTVHHRSKSADALIGSVREVSVDTVSGDVSVRTVQTLATIRTISGDTDLTGGTRIDAATTSGDIDFAANTHCRLDARTVSGDITIRRSGHQVDSRTRTVSGDVRER